MPKRAILYQISDAVNPYHWITSIRNTAFDLGWIKSHRFNLPVICIGNITVGGTGKTPHTEYLIKLFRNEYNIAVLSRGYGRKSKGFLKATSTTAMQMIGDEPHQIKSKFKEITVAVDEKRVHGIQRLLQEESAPQLILLDDAYQHRYVKAGVNILLVDNNRPIWRDSLLPIGRLRESPKGIERADIIIVTKCPSNMSEESKELCRRMLKTKQQAPVFFSTMKYGTPYPLFPDKTKKECITDKGANILLLTGIAKPAPLKKELERRGASVTLKQYADHHNFSAAELNNIANEFEKLNGNKIIITTEKDAARLTEAPSLPSIIKENIFALPIEVDFLDSKREEFNKTVKSAVINIADKQH